MRLTLVSPFDPFVVDGHGAAAHVGGARGGEASSASSGARGAAGPEEPKVPPGPRGAREAHVGGVERVYAEVARRLARRGHDVTLVCSATEPQGIRVQDQVRVIREPRRMTILRAPVAALERHVIRGADAVMVPATYPFTTPTVLRRARSLGIPSVLDFHFEPVVASPVGRVAATMYRQVGPRAYGFADAVVVRSLAYGRSAPSLAGVPERRWRVVPNGIDVERFRPAGSPAEGEYLLFVGRLVPYKGLDVLLRALATLRPALPLVVVGDGPLRASLEELARSLRVDARFLGRVLDDDLPGLYQGAALTVLPSVNGQEAFGIALLESMACGTPVVASELPGVADVARLGGLVAPVGDAHGWAETLWHALDDAALPRGEALAQTIHGRYSWEAVTDRVEGVLAEIADLPPRASSLALEVASL